MLFFRLVRIESGVSQRSSVVIGGVVFLHIQLWVLMVFLKRVKNDQFSLIPELLDDLLHKWK